MSDKDLRFMMGILFVAALGLAVMFAALIKHTLRHAAEERKYTLRREKIEQTTKEVTP